MIKPIVKDVFFLSQKSEPATKEDQQVAVDLQDTLRAHRAGCVGMAANMIGYKKRVIIVNVGMKDMIMFNPVMKKKEVAYETTEGCLSLIGQRETTRYDQITVEYQDERWKKQVKQFTGWTAQIIQHEMDHLEGIII